MDLAIGGKRKPYLSMMQKFSFSCLAATVVALAVLTACGKKEGAAPEASSEGAGAGSTEAAPAAAPPAATAANPGAESLPGENAVRAAMASKDYETAVSRLIALKPLATAGEKQTEYTALYGEVIDTLRAESATDQKAAAALINLNAITRGR